LRLTSKERVLAAFEHVEGDRVPVWCGASAEFWLKAKRELALGDEELRVRFGDDFRRVWARYAGPEFPLSPGATCRTVFGIERHGMGYGMPLSHPLAKATLADVEAYPWPDPAWTDVSNVRDDAVTYKAQYAILGGDWSPFWHDAIDLFGMDGLMIKMYEEPDLVDAAMNHILDYYFEVSRRVFDAAAGAIDIFFIGNDLGGQQGPLLGEHLFMRFVLPHIQRLIELGHAYRLKVMMHCCGGVSEFIPALIDVGLDALHAVQPSCRGMDLATLKREFGTKMVFNGAIDSHHVLIKGTPGLVRQKTREVLEIMMPGGGYIAGASHDSILEETPVENVLAMFDAVRECGVYA
jgi:uroporphyrinogen-III decarboxylase